MTDREKVIKGLRCLSGYTEMVENPCAGCGYTDCQTYAICVAQVARDALELLKKQEPIKPTVNVDTWICSKCGHTLESQELIDDKENPQVLIHEQYQYCPNCGKAVKWDE
jgi:rubrerythrin